MRYVVLACDYDETLARRGAVADTTLTAVRKLRGSGRAAVLVTGRELEELLKIFPQAKEFDRIVAENGALLYNPRTEALRTLAPPPSPAFVAALRTRDVTPLAVGHVIVATRVEHDISVEQALKEAGADLHAILNKDSIMVLPKGVDKATGLAIALEELKYTFDEVVGIGDGENDQVFLERCRCAVAVENAVPQLKEIADIVTQGRDGVGVAEIVERVLKNDLAEVT